MAATISRITGQLVEQHEQIPDLTLIQTQAEDNQLITPAELAHSLENYFSMVSWVCEAQATDAEIEAGLYGVDRHEFANYGLYMLSQLLTWSDLLELESSPPQLHQCVIVLAHWSSSYAAELEELPQLINSISYLANSHQQPEYLGTLAMLAAEIVKTVAPHMRIDKDESFWRLLNFNYGIVATRSHDTQLIETVFDQLLLNIPASAEAFFSEGMEQMDVVGYPAPVRELMEKYFLQTQNRVLH